MSRSCWPVTKPLPTTLLLFLLFSFTALCCIISFLFFLGVWRFGNVTAMRGNMKYLKMYYRGIWLVVNFSLPDSYMQWDVVVAFCLHSYITPISISLYCFQNSFSKISLPRFLKSSLEIETWALYSRRSIAGNVTQSRLDPLNAESGYRTIATSAA